MPKLILSGVSKALYDNKIACATLHYGTLSEPKDHCNKPLSDETNEFAEHLLTVCRPIFNKLKDFTVRDITYENNSSFPLLSTSHRDGTKEITKKDCETIQKQMQKIINQYNKTQSANSEITQKNKTMPTTAAAGMFATSSDSKENEAPAADPKKSMRLNTAGNKG